MSSHKDNLYNKKLKELLDNSQNQPMDDFEKEALEGFSVLKDESEIFELKASLDKRMEAQVFSPEKKQDKTYWYAAAGLLLVIGFTIYFVQNNLSLEKDNLAVHSEPIKEAQLIQKDSAADTVQFKAVDDLEKRESSAPVKEDKKIIAPEKKIVDAKLQTQQPGISANYSADQTAGGVIPTGETSPMSAPPAAANAISTPEAVAVKEKSERVQLEEVALSSSKSDRAKAAESKKRKQNENESTDKDLVSSSPAMAAEDAAPVGVYYEGGPAALNISLRNKLEPKNLLHNFNATVFINEKKKIQKVVLSNTGELTKDQQKEIIAAIKSLDKFNFSDPVEGKLVTEYKIVFRP